MNAIEAHRIADEFEKQFPSDDGLLKYTAALLRQRRQRRGLSRFERRVLVMAEASLRGEDDLIVADLLLRAVRAWKREVFATLDKGDGAGDRPDRSSARRRPCRS